MNHARTRSWSGGWLGLYSWLVFAFLYLPIVVLILYSFNGSGVGGFPPRDLTLSWYRILFHDAAIWNSVLNSLIVAMVAVGLALAIGIPAALALDRADFPGKAIFRRLVLLPLILPGIITGLSLLMLCVFSRFQLSLVTIALGHGTALIAVATTEIFAGAIQDYGRALIVGQQTYGKGTVQNAHPLNYTIFGRKPELGQLNVTIGKYYRITGESTQDRGVTPDISLPSLIDANEVGESTRDRALPWDHIEPAAFRIEGDLKPMAGALEKLHQARTAGSADFKYLHDDIAALDAMRSQKSLSLNIKTREAERKRVEAERLARENAWRASRDMKPAASLEEIKDDATAGILLDEASQIAADLVGVAAKHAVPTQARRNDDR